MIIDISSYNGTIDFDTLVKENDIERVIMRSTCKNGEPDTALTVNISRLKKADKTIPIDFYKFTYARDYAEAVVEAVELIYTLKAMVLLHAADTIYLDIEPVSGRVHTPKEIKDIIVGYMMVFKAFDVRLGIYCSYSYLKNMPDWSHDFPFWVARWNDTLGDISDYCVEMWQYTSSGRIKGIDGLVDLSRYV